MNTDRIFLNIATTDFTCPYCPKKYDDSNEFYLKRMNKNKSGITKIKCECKGVFGVAMSYNGLMSFPIKGGVPEFHWLHG